MMFGTNQIASGKTYFKPTTKTYPTRFDVTPSLSLHRMTQETTPMMVMSVIIMNDDDAMKSVSRMSSDETSESEFKPSPTSLAAALSPWNGIDVYLYCVTLKRHSVLKSLSLFSFKVNSTVATDKFYSLRFLTLLHNCYVIIRFHKLNVVGWILNHHRKRFA